jgi:fibrillarin-like pre-rRNA processing protein
MKEHRQLKGIYADEKNRLYTKSLAPGISVYGEFLRKEKDGEYRQWDTRRSKLGAAVAKGISQLGLKENYTVLYLGAATGTTVSHVSDIVGKNGFVFAVDLAPRVLRELVFVAEQRKNIAPILASANHPMNYVHLVPQVDFLFQDVSQRNQVEIFLKNIGIYLKKDGFAALALKARSVDVTKKPSIIFEEAKKQLEKAITIVDYRTLDPLERDHAFFVCKKK